MHFFKLLFLISNMVLFVTTIQAQENNRAVPEWIESINSAYSNWATDLVIDKDGNSYSTGYFSNLLMINDSINYNSCGYKFSDNNCFLIKRNSSGGVLWVRYGMGYLRTSKIKLDESGNVYVVGQVWSSSIQLTSSNCQDITLAKDIQKSRPNIFLCQYDSAGLLIRSKILHDISGQTPHDFLIDSNGDFIVGGTHEFRRYDKPSHVQNSYLLMKLNSDWQVIWKTQGDTLGGSYISSITLSPTAQIYVTGSYSERIDFHQKDLVLKISNSYRKSFVAKYDNNGLLSWVNDSINQPLLGTYGKSIVCDKEHAIYCSVQTHARRAFLNKLDSTGQTIWSKTLGGCEYLENMILDSAGNVYLCGEGYRANFGNFEDNYKEFSFQRKDGGTDFYIAKFNPYGHLLALNFGGKISTNYCKAIAVYQDKVYALGNSNNGLYFGDFHFKGKLYNQTWLAAFRLDDMRVQHNDK